jgi:hypothetical protein
MHCIGILSMIFTEKLKSFDASQRQHQVIEPIGRLAATVHIGGSVVDREKKLGINPEQR